MLKRLAGACVLACMLAGCTNGAPIHAAAPGQKTGRPPYHMTSPAPYGPADLQFADRMLADLGSAVTMSHYAAGRTENQQVLSLAAGLSAQAASNGQQVQEWFAQWRKRPEPAPAAPRGWPGLPSSTVLDRLASQRGNAFDRTLLRLVIANQQAMIDAARVEQASGTYGPATQLADQLASAGTLAIVRLRQTLKLLG